MKSPRNQQRDHAKPAHLGGGSGSPSIARDKIKAPDELAVLLDSTRKAAGKLILAHGVFDLLHMGHVNWCTSNHYHYHYHYHLTLTFHIRDQYDEHYLYAIW